MKKPITVLVLAMQLASSPVFSAEVLCEGVQPATGFTAHDVSSRQTAAEQKVAQLAAPADDGYHERGGEVPIGSDPTLQTKTHPAANWVMTDASGNAKIERVGRMLTVTVSTGFPSSFYRYTMDFKDLTQIKRELFSNDSGTDITVDTEQISSSTDPGEWLESLFHMAYFLPFVKENQTDPAAVQKIQNLIGRIKRISKPAYSVSTTDTLGKTIIYEKYGPAIYRIILLNPLSDTGVDTFWTISYTFNARSKVISSSIASIRSISGWAGPAVYTPGSPDHKNIVQKLRDAMTRTLQVEANSENFSKIKKVQAVFSRFNR